jgi:hypothetical protein
MAGLVNLGYPVMLGERFCLQEYYSEDEEIIYRYLSFDKFKDLISSRKLYLARGDRFEDTYEGVETAFGADLRRAVHDDHAFEENSKLYERNRRCVAISCWFIGNRESESMWNEFAGDIDGIAIRTNVGKIRSALTHRDRHLCMRKIEYVENHDVEFTKFGCPFFPFSIKRKKQFAQESELRIIYGEGKGCVEGSPLYNAPEISSEAVRIQIDPSVLIEEIILSPKSTPSVFDKVRKVTQEEGLDVSVVRSGLI